MHKTHEAFQEYQIAFKGEKRHFIERPASILEYFDSMHHYGLFSSTDQFNLLGLQFNELKLDL